MSFLVFVNNTIIVGNFNTPLQAMDRCSKQKTNEETMAVNDRLDQKYLIVIFKTFHPKIAEYTFFPSARGTFFRIGHMLDQKTSLKKLKNIYNIPSMFSKIL